MKYSQSEQKNKFDFGFSWFNFREIDDFLYFTIDLGFKNKQLWKTDGKTTVFVANI